MNFKNIFFDIDDFELTENFLGRGSFGEVYIARCVNNSELYLGENNSYAAKIIKINPKTGFTGTDQMKFMRESTILKSIDHPAIVKFVGINIQSFDDQNKLEPAIITEYIPNGSLFDHLHSKNQKKSSLSPTKKVICIIGIANAMKYIHEQKTSSRFKIRKCSFRC